MLNWQAGLMAGSCGGSSDDPSTGSRMHCSHACCTGCRHGSCNLSHLKLSHIKMITCAGSILYTWYTISSQHPSGACLRHFCFCYQFEGFEWGHQQHRTKPSG